VDVVITPAVAKTATSAVAKLLGGLVPGLVREVRRKRAVRRSVRALSERQVTGLDSLVERMEATEAARLLAYVRLPDFEQFAIQLTGMALERKRPEKYVADLRAALTRSLRLHGAAADEDVVTALFDELWAAVVVAIGEVGQTADATAALGTTMTVSVRAAAATRNSQLLERLRTLDDMQAFIRTLRSQVGRVDGFIRPPHVESGRRVPLASLFVEPRLMRNVSGSTLRQAEPLVSKEVLAGSLRTVVLGDPGGGKSTLATMITCHIARSTESGLRGTVPFLVVMRDYAEVFQQQQLSVARYLQALVSARYQLEPPRDWVEYVLLNGRGVVIFDGLDELLDTSLRRKIVAAVEAFSYAYPTTTILVTSRRIGYEQAPLDETLFTVLHLSEFDDDQITAYVEKWFALDSDLRPEDRQELVQAFVRESDHVPDLRRSPLMLALMCALYRGEGYIPRNRLDLYERCSVMLFERWDRQRGISVPLPFEQHVRPALCAMAEWMFTKGDNQPAVTERELVATVRRFLLRKRFDDLDEADAAAKAFVEYCRGRAWVLTEVGTTGDGEPLFAFTHRTFLEFFTANQLVRTNSGVRPLLDALLPHIYNEEWDVVAQLAVLLLDRYVEGGADDFLDLLISDAANRDPDESVPALTFAARMLSTFVPAPPVRRRLFDACWDLASSVDGDAPRSKEAPWSRLAPAGHLLFAAKECRESIATLIRTRVSNGNHPGVSALLAVTMDQLLGEADHQYFPTEMRKFWYDETVNNREPLRATFASAAKQHVWAAVEAAFNGDLSITELIDTHGAAAVCESPPIWGMTYRRAPIIQQEVLLYHNPDLNRPGMWGSADPRIGSWTDELAALLPLAPTPWARLSRLPWWDMSFKEPLSAAPTGTARFETMVLCACLHWEARFLLHRIGYPHVPAEPLPSWLSFQPQHPAQSMIANAARARYGGGLSPFIPDGWLSPAVRGLVDRWASREVDLVRLDSGEYGPY
jgi:hypothetical protein